MFFNCGKKAINNPPVITSLKAEPNTLQTNEQATITCEANDSDK